MTNKVAIILLAGTETHEGLARMTNAFQATREFIKDDEVKLILDGAGTEWAKTLSNPDHDAHQLYLTVKDQISGVCKFCSGAFDVTEDIEDQDLPFSDEHHGHPSFKKLVDEGYQIITF